MSIVSLCFLCPDKVWQVLKSPADLLVREDCFS